MKEKVLMCKETGELHLKTNKWNHDDEIPFSIVLLIGLDNNEKRGLMDWYDDMYEDLGEL